jgi:hypothetical protein
MSGNNQEMQSMNSKQKDEGYESATASIAGTPRMKKLRPLNT